LSETLIQNNEMQKSEKKVKKNINTE
jgi:hypothetical protein